MTAHPGPLLSDILLSSPILTDEEGAPLAPLGQGFEFGIDPTEDPELAMVHTQTYMQFSKSHITCMKSAVHVLIILVVTGSTCVHGGAETAAGGGGEESDSGIH